MYLHNLESWLIEKADFYNNPSFIKDDPISIPHSFSKKNDIEIAAIFSATIAWGNRTAIIKSAKNLMNIMDNAPYQFVSQCEDSDLEKLSKFVYRTFNSFDAISMCIGLKNIYLNHGGLENVFSKPIIENSDANAFDAIENFRNIMLSIPHEKRFEKHISSPLKGSAAKRLNMFLRWMVRQDDRGVDFGLWKSFPMSKLLIPLDLHSARVARNIGILKRKQTDAKAVFEVTDFCRKIDANDPAKFDFALFGYGVNEKKI